MKKLLNKFIIVTFFIGVIFFTSCRHGVFISKDQGYVQVDDGAIYYETVGKGKPIVILHGGPGLDHSYFLPQMLELAKDYKLIFYDQRGSGKSYPFPVNEETITIDKFVQDIEVLKQHLGLEKFVLMGHSWGSLLAMKYAIEHPESLESLILVGVSPVDGKGFKAFHDRVIDELGLASIEKAQPLFSYEAFSALDEQGIAEAYRALFSTYFADKRQVEELSLKFNLSAAQSGFKVSEEISKKFWFSPDINLFPYLKQLEVPTLIINGEADGVPVSVAEEINEAILRSELIVIKECGHFPYIEKPGRFFKAVRLYVDQQRASN